MSDFNTNPEMIT